MQVTFYQTPEPWAQPWAPPAPSSSTLLFCSALGLTTYSAQRRLRCHTCSFAKPCYPVPTECQDNEACGISIGTSEQGETIQQKGCLPRAPCSLPGHATYRSHSYVLQHDCCTQDLWNVATVPQHCPSLLLIALLLMAAFTWGGNLLH